MAKEANALFKAAKVDKKKEHEVVFEWCVQSTSLMLDVMTVHQKKSFVRKVKD